MNIWKPPYSPPPGSATERIQKIPLTYLYLLTHLRFFVYACWFISIDLRVERTEEGDGIKKGEERKDLLIKNIPDADTTVNLFNV